MELSHNYVLPSTRVLDIQAHTTTLYLCARTAAQRVRPHLLSPQ